MGPAPSPPPRGFAISSTRQGCDRASRLPAHGDEQAAARRVEPVHELVFLVERVLQLGCEVGMLAVVVARGEIDDGIAGVLNAGERRDVIVRPPAGTVYLPADAQRTKALISGKRAVSSCPPDRRQLLSAGFLLGRVLDGESGAQIDPRDLSRV